MSKGIIPLARPDIQEADINEVSRVLKSGMLVQGKEVNSFEKSVNKYLGTQYCSAVSNGTSALHLALIACNVKPHNEVILPAFSYVATANVIELVGAKCIFVDINLDSFNIDITKIEKAITSKTKAIIPVHEFGLCANMPEIMKIAEKHNLTVIEDAACALGATYNSKQAGTFGHFGAFSLHPRKAITSGEGGLLVTPDLKLDKKIKTLRNHGIEPSSNPMNFIEAGFNYRLTDFQAALARSQFMRLDKIIEYRNKLASIYLTKIINPAIRLPKVPDRAKHTWQTFHILLESNDLREKLKTYLKKHGVLTNYGAQCIPAMTYYQKKYQYNSTKDYKFAYESFTCGLAIPLYERLTEKQIIFISDLINKF